MFLNPEVLLTHSNRPQYSFRGTTDWKGQDLHLSWNFCCNTYIFHWNKTSHHCIIYNNGKYITVFRILNFECWLKSLKSINRSFGGMIYNTCIVYICIWNSWKMYTICNSKECNSNANSRDQTQAACSKGWERYHKTKISRLLWSQEPKDPDRFEVRNVTTKPKDQDQPCSS
jgi:hypothetical protein